MLLNEGWYVTAIAKCIEFMKLLCITKPMLTHYKLMLILTERDALPSTSADEASLKQLAVRRSSMDTNEGGRLKAFEIDRYDCSDSGSGSIAL